MADDKSKELAKDLIELRNQARTTDVDRMMKMIDAALDDTNVDARDLIRNALETMWASGGLWQTKLDKALNDAVSSPSKPLESS